MNLNQNIRYTCLLLLISLMGCYDAPKKHIEYSNSFHMVLARHLYAIQTRNIKELKSTLSPKSDIWMMLPKDKIRTTNKEFIKYHEEWFNSSKKWSLESKILKVNVGTNMGVAVVGVMYKEPNRKGKPYFNRMAVSYTLKKIGKKWYVVKDHACSLEKSTDSKEQLLSS